MLEALFLAKNYHINTTWMRVQNYSSIFFLHVCSWQHCCVRVLNNSKKNVKKDIYFFLYLVLSKFRTGLWSKEWRGVSNDRAWPPGGLQRAQKTEDKSSWHASCQCHCVVGITPMADWTEWLPRNQEPGSNGWKITNAPTQPSSSPSEGRPNYRGCNTLTHAHIANLFKKAFFKGFLEDQWAMLS